MTSAEIRSARLPWDAADPYPFYERRRRHGNVVWDDTAQAWLVLGYDAARQVLGGTGWTSDPFANALAQASVDAVGREFARSSMLFADGDVHRRLRGSVRDVFTRGFVADLGEGVRSIADSLIGHQPAATEFDFMAEIALPLPIAVISAWLDLGSDAAHLLREVSPVIIRMLGTLADPDEMTAGTAASAALMAEFLPTAADRRTHPGDDLFSFIAGDPALSLDEVVTTAILIAVAGHETTANLLGAAMMTVLTPDADGARIADRVDPADPALVAELIRLDAPVQSTVRTATTTQRLDGITIEAGQSVLVAVAAANRDPAVFDEPDRLRLDRAAPAPLSFGYGAHYCLGAALAQLELSIALPAILARRPALSGPVSWRDTPAIRGPLSVPMVFGG
ncbi:cytochrome P450 [Mycolicibacterium canariasense]|uniref:Cytochrome P450 n=1 Tax=Mycolicibacterium canariasense TaxID=228230 RepID=A0A117I9V2_MYCCR|nr:cytochrome P450 [Mycolicibacterium canariasense]MCV7209145.1 cytochrome P450 [Mycolicibacterium canariasense]ORV06002.1 cytochrome [Mycolicibacterium canariasense]GAS95330.1 cytochrome P450 [Mycolicibacterium canariasense]